ncbi:MAG: hypothetical protein V1874_17145 [Spirochaetota bacterium]
MSSLHNKHLFRKIYDGDNQVEVLLNGEYVRAPGIWPLIDENFDFTGYVGIGTKGSIPEELYKKIKTEYKKELIFVHPTLNGPYFYNNYNFIINEFNAVFDLDYVYKIDMKSLNLIFSMIVRSMPYRGFFWNNNSKQKDFDFSILTWGPSDLIAKRWDRAERVCDYLCSKGLKGLIVTQRGEREDLINHHTETHVKSSNLVIYNASFSEIEFHNLMCEAMVSIFPNVQDAFPKHIMESLLADKPIIFAKDLMFGTKTLQDLGEDVAYMIDFDDVQHSEKIYQHLINLKKNRNRKSPREEWLKRYNFIDLSKIWAKEFNRLLKTNFGLLFFMNHIPRVKEHKLL